MGCGGIKRITVSIFSQTWKGRTGEEKPNVELPPAVLNGGYKKGNSLSIAIIHRQEPIINGHNPKT